MANSFHIGWIKYTALCKQQSKWNLCCMVLHSLPLLSYYCRQCYATIVQFKLAVHWFGIQCWHADGKTKTLRFFSRLFVCFLLGFFQQLQFCSFLKNSFQRYFVILDTKMTIKNNKITNAVRLYISDWFQTYSL